MSKEDGLCFYCGQATDHFAGNPGLWPMVFPETGNPGVPVAHHTKCVLAKLADERRLRAAIMAHRSQLADDRCIEDDDRLYEALGDGIKCDRRVGDKFEMLKNCIRFVDRRCDSGGPWKSYAVLKQENCNLKE